MLLVEYLVFADKNNIKCNDERSFNHFLQSDPDIVIGKSGIVFNGLAINYNLTVGTVKNVSQNYFHLKLECPQQNKIDEYIAFLRALKSLLHSICSAPQTLFDGVSLHYATIAYPLIFDVENLMRKLITKFMMINIGINWSKDRTPEDVRASINTSNNDQTYLHNVDFIQLKNFLFSENYPVHKENLISKLKAAKDIVELDLEEIKKLIPQSNWDRYFSETLKISKKQLEEKWDSLYLLRCQVAHNKTFGKADYTKVEQLCSEIKPLLLKAIEELDTIEVSESESKIVTESVAGNFSFVYGEFMFHWANVEMQVINLYKHKVLSRKPSEIARGRGFTTIVGSLLKARVLESDIVNDILRYYNRRNRIVHNDGEISPEEVSGTINGLTVLAGKLQIISNDNT